jgi:hypothetical protein
VSDLVDGINLPLFDFQKYTLVVAANSTRRIPSWTYLHVISATASPKWSLANEGHAVPLPVGRAILAPRDQRPDSPYERLVIDHATIHNDSASAMTVVIEVGVGLELKPGSVEIATAARTAAALKRATVNAATTITATLLAASSSTLYHVYAVGLFSEEDAPGNDGAGVKTAKVRWGATAGQELGEICCKADSGVLWLPAPVTIDNAILQLVNNTNGYATATVLYEEE